MFVIILVLAIVALWFVTLKMFKHIVLLTSSVNELADCVSGIREVLGVVGEQISLSDDEV